MKVVSAKMISEIEARAYRRGHTERDFMENAGRGIALAAQQFIEKYQLPHNIWLLCGKGNNGGDAFVAGRYLLDQGYPVTAIQHEELYRCSPLCQENGRRFLDKKGKLVNQLVSFGSGGVIIDGLFGTGFKGQVREPYASLIEAANRSGLPILAIDIPSGLDGSSGQIEGSVIHATETIFLGLPKTGFFLENGWNVVGNLRGVDFGLPADLIEQAAADFHLNTQDQIARLLPPIKRNRHKYQAGYVLGLAGSPTMPGAALLSTLAALRGGSGMVRLLYPHGMEAVLSSSPYELIKIPYTYDQPQEVSQIMQKGGATFIGPGLGHSEQIGQFLQKIVPTLEKPCVIDADALTLFAEGAFQLPKQALLTPHTGEMQRLLKSSTSLILNLDLLHTCQRYAEEHRLTLILKGAPSFIFHPQTSPCVNPTGDPGMATAGSGDVLTGLLASLLSQGLNCHQAALLGVYLHGLAGELAAEKRGVSYGMIASDLITHFDSGYEILQNSD
jgi:ADP-dependent NAD(P)H-hydrate dehydratase / NAD(P)H-hydrate epimerase